MVSSAGGRRAARVGTLTERLGWSRKRLVAAFHPEIGLPPKTVARRIRFEHAQRRLEGEEPAIAVGAGYADQPHMIREFVELAGVTPRHLVGSGTNVEEQIFNLAPP